MKWLAIQCSIVKASIELFRIVDITRSLLVLAIIGWGLGELNAGEAQPNILFILADDMGWQDTSVPFAERTTKWNDRYRTPALERLAHEGMKFAQAYSCRSMFSNSRQFSDGTK